ncbi:MAG: DUF72 domain-containing protein [Sinomicrobium sp.]|nr:DUF72 domain-containing protein [Sinomicrobium sp.]
MKFGKVNNPDRIDFSLPEDHPDTARVLSGISQAVEPLRIYVGCAKWNRQDLKNFYPRGTKNELEYYGRQFNCIELNATFYRNFPSSQFEKWYHAVPAGFKFFPKVHQNISHLKRLVHVEDALAEFSDGIVHLNEKLGTVFLQMHSNFAPKDFGRLVHFIALWPKAIPLAVELRHTDWFNDAAVAQELCHLLEENNIANVIVDTAGRRDLLHMRLTNNEAFIRFVGANHTTDYSRMDDWIRRLQVWKERGLQRIHFFVHQHMEQDSPLLSAYFIKNMNAALGTDLKIPVTLDSGMNTLF